MRADAPDLRLETFEQRLASHRPAEVSRLLAPKRAAVAALLRFDGGGPEVLLIQRPTSATDPWSGQVSFPGGREDHSDADPLATAVRETREEVGLDLRATARLLGRLDDTRATAHGRFLPMAIRPFVFVQEAAQAPAPSAEVVEAFWLPLEPVVRGELDGRYEHSLGPVPLSLPCWRWNGKVVWGLTHRMLRNLLAVVAPR